VEDAIERIPQIRKEQLEIDREEAREKKAVEEAAKKASKGDADAVVNPVDADAALAALLFEKENSRSSRRVTRGLEETPQEKVGHCSTLSPSAKLVQLSTCSLTPVCCDSSGCPRSFRGDRAQAARG
jgi:hypothetical protein